MTDFGLKFRVPDSLSEAAARRNFFWTATGIGSYATTLTPRLSSLGPVPSLNADFVRLAVLVYSADRSVLRRAGSVNWTSRAFALSVPVTNPALWESVNERLTQLLWFLSGDTWTLKFTKAAVPKSPATTNAHPDAQRVVLLSGGADSGCGALRARVEESEHVLFSHFGGNGVGPKQREVAELIRNLAPGGSTQWHVQVGFRRKVAQPNGTPFKKEHSTRTRSLLFLALGLAVASMNEVPVWIPENGFASLNPPMGADQLGSVSTKTTHPWFLAELSGILSTIGAQGVIENPFMHHTKGEMFRWVSDSFGPEAASSFLSSTDSCGFTNKRFWGIPRGQHCGTCFGCLMRRASFKAADVQDQTTYAVDSPPSARAGEVLEAGSLLPSIKAHVARGVRVADIASMRLPTGYTPGMARDLCVRGTSELGLLV